MPKLEKGIGYFKMKENYLLYSMHTIDVKYRKYPLIFIITLASFVSPKSFENLTNKLMDKSESYFVLEF